MKYGQQLETRTSAEGGVAFYEGESLNMGELEAKMWLEAILDDKDPVVLPEQALVVTRILEAIYESARTGESVKL
ncbi:hypothetical protein D3C75_1352660 [compost metagenome]